MTELACAQSADESWDKFLHVLSGIERSSENDLAACGDLDNVQSTAIPQDNYDPAVCSKPGASLAPTVDKVENRRQIQVVHC